VARPAAQAEARKSSWIIAVKKLLIAAAPYLTLIALSLLYCAPLFSGLDGHRVPAVGGRGDWDQFTFRRLTPRLAMLRDFQIPLWNPYVNGGNVLLAHPHCPAFSPWYLPTLIFGAELGVRIEVLLLVILGATGMAALLRQWNVSRAGSLLGGMLLMMGSHFTLHLAEGHAECHRAGADGRRTAVGARAREHQEARPGLRQSAHPTDIAADGQAVPRVGHAQEVSRRGQDQRGGNRMAARQDIHQGLARKTVA
jgi:hypothetical protein